MINILLISLFLATHTIASITQPNVPMTGATMRKGGRVRAT